MQGGKRSPGPSTTGSATMARQAQRNTATLRAIWPAQLSCDVAVAVLLFSPVLDTEHATEHVRLHPEGQRLEMTPRDVALLLRDRDLPGSHLQTVQRFMCQTPEAVVVKGGSVVMP